MKKAGIFAAVIALVLLFMQFYNYRLWAYTQDAVYVIDREAAVERLKNGLEEGENGELTLSRYEASTPIYTRGKKWFIGEDYEALDTSYPVYVNEGNFLYSFSDEMRLVTSEFDMLDTYEGIYVAEGKSYNNDREQADPDEFIFVAAGDGLYLNAQDMVIHSTSRSRKIAANSLMDLQEEAVNYYSFDAGAYVYGNYGDVVNAEVEIGSVTISYEELLAKLRSVTGNVEEEKETNPAETTEEETPALETSAPGETFLAAETPASQTEAVSEETRVSAEAETDRETEEEVSEAATEPTDPRDPTDPDHPPRPGRPGRLPFEGDAAQKDDSGQTEQGGGGESGGESGGSGGESGGESGGPGEELPPSAPEASFSDFTFGVYHGEGMLTLEDPGNLIIKGIRVVFYEKGQSRAAYRKLLRVGGEMIIEPLKPDTEYEAEGYFDYMDPNLGKQRVVFFERQEVGKTLPLSALKPMTVSQQPETDEYFPYSIEIRELTAKTADGPASPSRAASRSEALNYIATVQSTFEKSGSASGTPQAILGSSQLAALKRGETVLWKTGDILTSNSRYRYELKFYDRYGNELPLTAASVTTGESRTSKQPPKASLSMERSSDVRSMKVEVDITNPDKAVFTGKPYLYVTYADQPGVPISFTLDGVEGTLKRYELSEGKENLSFTSLLPSTAYTLWVKGTYDLEDKKEHKEELMGELSVTTDSLSSLGTVSFNISAEQVTSDSADLRISARTPVNDALYPFLTQVNVTVSGKDGYQEDYALLKEKLDQEIIQPGETYTIRQDQTYGPKISLTLPKDSQAMSPWRALLTRGTLMISYPEKSLASATDHEAEIRSYAVRGSAGSSDVIREDVTGRYFRGAFKTLKQKVYVDYDMSFINATSATYYDLRILDPDGAVIGGNITVRLKRQNGSVADVRVYQLADLNAMESLTFTGLDANAKYTLEFVAQEYNEGYTNTTRELQKLLYLEDGSSITFEAKNTLWGSLTPDRMSQDYDLQTASMGVGVAAENLLDINDAVWGMQVGTTAAGDTVNNSYTASAFIPVEPGKAYIGSGIGTVYCYDENKKYLNKSYSSVVKDSLPGIFTAPLGCKYIRTNVANGNLPGAYFSEALYVEADSAYNLVDAETITVGQSINSENYNKYPDYAHTDYIKVDAGKRYFRSGSASMKDSKLTLNDWRTRRVYFYDANKQLLKTDAYPNGYTDSAEEAAGVIVPPAGCEYVRLNLAADSKDRLFFGGASPLVGGKDLLANVSWTEGVYGTAFNNTSPQAYSYQRRSGYVKVEPRAVYKSAYVDSLQLFDEEENFLGYFPTGNDASIRIPEDGYYVRVNNNKGENGNQIPHLWQVTPQREDGEFDVRLKLELSDSQGSLGTEPSFTLVYTQTDAQGKEKTWKETREVSDLSGVYLEYPEFTAETGCSYQVDLTIELGGRTIILDSAAVSAGVPVGILRSEAALYGVRYNPVGEYLVTGDIKVTRSDLIPYFYGYMDFQGHKVTMDNCRTLFQYLLNDGLVENLVLDSRLTAQDKSVSNTGALIHTNRGTLHNIVLRLNMDNQRENINFGGLAYFNYGTIENFAIELTGDFYGRANVSPGVNANYGVMRNGYLVSSDRYRMQTGPKNDANKNYRGGLVALNRGTAENIYSVVSLEATEVIDKEKEYAARYSGVAVGSNIGILKNTFGVGQNLVNDLPSPNYGPAVGNAAGQTENISYVLPEGASGNGYKNPNNTQVMNASLRDEEWLNTAINGDGAFDFEPVSGGYYPQLHMPDVMKGKQPLLALPEAERSQPPRILSSTVLEQTEDRALVQFEVENRSRLEIRDMNLAVLDSKHISSTESRYYLDRAAVVSIAEQGLKEDGSYYVNVEVKEPQYFRSLYYVKSVTAGLPGNTETDEEYEQWDSQGNPNQLPEVAIEFFKPIRNLDQWKSEFESKTIDLYGNYRIRAQELDFRNIQPSEFDTAYRITSRFYGVIDGGWTDEAGQRHTAVLKNLNLSNHNGLITALNGTVRNLMVDGLVINEKQTSGAFNRGLIQEVSGGLVENVHIRNGRLYGNHRSGMIAGHMGSGSTLRECSASDSFITTYAHTTNKAAAGGLVGLAAEGSLEQCYVQGMIIDSTKALDMEGTGGLVGYCNTGKLDFIDCYAEGTIRSAYRNVGGLAGYVAANAFTMEHCYTKMDLDVFGSYVGGLAGYVSTGRNEIELSGSLAIGDVFVHSADPAMTHRLIGSEVTDQYAGGYAFAGQLYAGNAEGTDDAAGFLDGDALRKAETYEKTLGFGESYALDSVSDGYLPLLKDRKGELLPWQEPILIPGSEASLSVEAFDLNQKAADEYKQMFEDKAPFSQAYAMTLKISYDTDVYKLASVSVEGLELNGIMNDKTTYKDSVFSGGVQRRYPFVVEKLGGDVYCVIVILENKNDPTQQIRLSAMKAPTTPISRTIQNAADWNKYMTEFGQSYGNFILAGDIDAKDAELVTNVRINSLKGATGKETIKNIDHTVTGTSDALISSCLTRIEGVRFENINWTVAEGDTSSHTDVGLIGLNQGRIRDVEFTNVNINSGTGTRTGCIAYNLGDISDVTLTDIKVSSTNIYTGGLAGQTTQPVRRITAKGTLTEDPDASGIYTSTYEVRGYQHVGGIVGNGQACESISVNGIRVLGENLRNQDGIINAVGGIVGAGMLIRAGGTIEENTNLASAVENCVVETAVPQADDKRYDAQYVGGAIGSGNAYFVHGRNLLVRGPKANGVGGISGSYTEKCDLTTVPEKEAKEAGYTILQTRITGEENVGGLSGKGHTNSGRVSFIEVEATKANAGGVSGYAGSGMSNNVVDSVKVTAPLNVGGLIGNSVNGAVASALVLRSEVTGGVNVGGIIGKMETTPAYIHGSGVVDTVITAEKSEASDSDAGGESNAGGLIGMADVINYLSSSYVKDTSITAAGDNVGGLAGAAKGGHYYRCISNAAVKTAGQNGGGLIGKLTGSQPALTTEYANAKIYESYSYSTVEAKDYAGGIIGKYTCDVGAFYDLTPANTYGLLSMGDVISEGGKGSLLVNVDETRTDLTGRGGYLRVFEEARLTTGSQEAGGQENIRTGKDIYPNAAWEDEKPVSAEGTKEDGNPALAGILTVNGKSLTDKRMYNNTYEKGGMNWISGWSFEGLGRMEDFDPQKVSTNYGNVPSKVFVDGQEYVEIPAKGKPTDVGFVFTDVPKGETPTGEIRVDEPGAAYYWYRVPDPEINAWTHVNNGQEAYGKDKKMELAGRGYYGGYVHYSAGWRWTALIKVDTPAYLPYVTGGSAVVRGALEGFTFETEDPKTEPLMNADGSYKVYNGTDMLYYGGIEVPLETSGTISVLDLKDGAAQVYPSGPDTINVELCEDYEGLACLTVKAGGAVLLEEKPGKRVYTLPYDYQSTVTVTARFGEEEFTTAWDATELRRTVMVWGDDYYYTSDGKLYDGTGLCLDRQILHLYGGKALAADGTVYEAESGKAMEKGAAQYAEAVAVAEADYEGRHIRTYGSFTKIATAANAALSDEAVPDGAVREQQLFVKDGTLFAMQNSQSSRGFVLDSYNGQTFMSALNDKGELKDHGDALKTPEHFRRQQIAHMTNAMDSDEPYVLVRYVTGEARGFNYVTGEELPVENAFSDVSLLDFASGFMEDLVGQTGQGNKAFADLKKLEEELKLSPITEEQLVMAQKATEGAAGNEGAPEEKDPIISESRDDGQEDGGLDADGSAEADGLAEGEGEEVIDGPEEGGGDKAADGPEEGGEDKAADGQEEGNGEKVTDGQSQKEDKQENQTEQSDGSQPDAENVIQTARPDYVYSFNTDEETYELYNSQELLNRKEEELLSENRKMETLQAAGMFAGDTYVKHDTATRQEKKGLTMFVFAALAALSLSGVLIYRKGRRKDDKK